MVANINIIAPTSLKERPISFNGALDKHVWLALPLLGLHSFHDLGRGCNQDVAAKAQGKL